MRASAVATALVALSAVPRLASAVVSDADIHFRIFKVPSCARSGERTTLDAAQIARQFAEPVCRCQEAFVFEIYLSANVASQVGRLTGGRVEIWAGTNCNDPGTATGQRELRCAQLATPNLSAFTTAQDFCFTADQFSVATAASGSRPISCPEQQVTPGLWALVDENSDGTYEAKAQLQIPYDGQPPGEPVGQVAEAANEAVLVKWDVDPSSIADVDAFQVLCARGGGLQVFRGPPWSPGYKSIATECMGRTPLPPPPDGGAAPPTDAGVPDGASASPIVQAPGDDGGAGGAGGTGTTSTPVPPYGPFVGLDPAYVCSERLAKTVRSQRIGGLQNGIPYEFAVVAIDKVGNPSKVSALQLIYPTADEDAYNHYRDAGGKATGGFCAVAWSAAAAPLGLIVLLAIGAALAGRARVRRRP
ncbi:MAG TPA: hypothetical protein VKN99_26450 [Polyangia bacterium]|nr:hypothetical protein [Polyangia bacterium]